jgi:hypothetical protein
MQLKHIAATETTFTMQVLQTAQKHWSAHFNQKSLSGGGFGNLFK